MPHGTKRSKRSSRVVTFSATPCVVTQSERWTPMAASLSFPTQTDDQRAGTSLLAAVTPKSAAVRRRTSSSRLTRSFTSRSFPSRRRIG
jgi:hypothetical protein